MTEGTDLTPQDGTGANLTPDGATDAGRTADGTPDSTAPDVTALHAELDQMRQRYAASTTEAQRLYQENLRLQQFLSATPQSAQPSEDDRWTEFSDAVLDRKPDKIKQTLGQLKDEVKREMMAEANTATTRQSRISASISYLQNNLKDPNDPVSKAAMTRYQQIMYDPAYTTLVAEDNVQVGTMSVNPHLLRMAVMEAKAGLGGKLASAAAEAGRAAEHYTEPTQAAQNRSSAFAPTKHLSDGERAYCDTIGKKYEDYWKYMDEDVKKARIKEGKPLKKSQI